MGPRTTSPSGELDGIATLEVMLDLDDARRRYHFALAPEDSERVPFYRALLAGLEEDPTTLELLASVRVEQRNPMLILAVLHFAALRGHDVLTPLYNEVRDATTLDVKGAAAAVLAEVRRSPSLVARELWRSTQTNEPGRSAVIQGVVGDLVDEDTAINLVDVGSSAGINLWFDKFSVRDVDDGRPLTLVCSDVGPIARRASPEVLARTGIDPHPLDLDVEDDRLWLKACIWPEERRRHERFDTIVAAHRSWPTTTVLRGGALERLNEALLTGPKRATNVVVNSWVAFYLSQEEREAYFATVTQWCRERGAGWISIESSLVRWPGVSLTGTDHQRAASQVVVARPGEAVTLWGWCHPHGRWLEKRTT